jgi:UDP-N-acetylmuramoylalanine--D-glutamate ligase
MTGPGGRVLPLDSIPIPGEHNHGNVAAAVATGLVLGIAPDAIRRAVEAFAGVEHRLELVAIADGVRYINDSQGTQPDAVIAAVRAFPKPLVLIAGGRDKGIEMDRLAAAVAERVSAAVLIGESGPDLARRFADAGLTHVEGAATLEEAVRRADTIARELLAAGPVPGGEPATVLMSPAAASFDMFVDYAARGRAFKSAVIGIVKARGGGERTW